MKTNTIIEITTKSMNTIIASIKPLVKKGVKASFVFGPKATDTVVQSIVTVVSENGTEQIKRGFYSEKPSGYVLADESKPYAVINVPADTFCNITGALLPYESNIAFVRDEKGRLALSVQDKAVVYIPEILQEEMPVEIPNDPNDLLLEVDFSSSEALQNACEAIRKGSAFAEDTNNVFSNTVPFVIENGKLMVYSTNKSTSVCGVGSCMVDVNKNEEKCKNFFSDKKLPFTIFPVPCTAIPVILDCLHGAGGNAKIHFGMKRGYVKTKGTFYVFSLAANCPTQMPSVASVFNKAAEDTAITVDANDVLKALAICSIAEDNRKVTVSLKVSSKKLVLSTDGGTSIDVPAIASEGVDSETIIRIDLLKKAINANAKGNLTIAVFEFNNARPISVSCGTIGGTRGEKLFVLPCTTNDMEDEKEESEKDN